MILTSQSNRERNYIFSKYFQGLKIIEERCVPRALKGGIDIYSHTYDLSLQVFRILVGLNMMLDTEVGT